MMFRRVRRYALHVSLFCALWTPLARAQSASFDPESPELLPLPPPRAVTVDRAAEAGSQRADTRRRDHLGVGALVGVGFPRPLAAEGVIKLERLVLLGAEYSALPSITVSGVQASCWAAAADVRIFPLVVRFSLACARGNSTFQRKLRSARTATPCRPRSRSTRCS